ncbi:hypothetical protein K491DRAFT_784171 [Lophiostoma macrostomum CBS 122681]|uniref:separase n=1 Tax=Lophiostoma macrostomum CBS 122681 TaxID=1314788 RepID=A0A6A6SKP1_9PLEO|nr:hypothetical protein K491DRAFT_784171 [Lophiostoma macrostomum CBS 122681]
MATKQDTPRASIQSIKTDLRSVSTCSPATIASLRGLLCTGTEGVVQKENARVQGSQLLSIQSTTRRKGVTAKTTATVTVATQKSTDLPPRDKYILATEVVNITLKSLADALRSQPTRALSKQELQIETDAPKSAKTCPPSSHNPSYTQTPLQERSASQAANSPTKPRTLRRSLSALHATLGSNSGLVALAECARLAFSYLRTPGAVKLAAKDGPILQVENGSLALVGKLVAHGLDNMAIKELRTLKRGLDQFIGCVDASQERGNAKSTSRAKNASTSPERETVASLLNFRDVDPRSPAVPIIVTYQIYVLRIIARTRQSCAVEEAWPYLRLSNPGAPANLLWHMAKAPVIEPKLLRQLESLAQTVLSMCSSVSSSKDGAVDGDRQLPPDIAFSLQHLAFKIRQRWWMLANHKGNVEKELLEPFSKCLVAFAKRSDFTPTKKYRLAEFLYTDLMGTRKEDAVSNAFSESEGLAYRTLSTLAHSASLVDEALRWLEPSGSSPTSKASAAKSATRFVKVAVLALHPTLKDDAKKPDIERAVADALGALSASLDGSSVELDALMLEVNSLRRTASATMLTGLRTGVFNLTCSLQSRILDVISASVHFAARYLGSRPEPDADARMLARYQQSSLTIAKSVKSIIDSICMCSKIPIGADMEGQWTTIHALFQDGIHILRHLEDNSQDLDDVPFPFAKVSNAYWSLQLQLRKANGHSATSIAAMRQSVDALQPRRLEEQQSGHLAMKLEKLGEALGLMDDVVGSCNAFKRCVKLLIDLGVLQQATNAAAGLALSQIFVANEPTDVLGRVLKSYHRSAVKGVDGLVYYDDCELSDAGRGILLEWQLTLFSKTLFRTRKLDAHLTKSLRTLSQRLLEIYALGRFPVRRRRVYALLMRISHEYPDVVPSSVLVFGREDFEAGADGSHTEDQGLARYDEHLRALLKLKIELQVTSPSIATLRECFCVWESLIDSAPTWKDLSQRVDDVESWVAEMQGVADYMAAKGEEYTCIPALQLVSIVRKLQNDEDPTELISSYCTLGLQLLQLGYSGKAGLAFAKVEALMNSKRTSTEAKLRWHIGYAEYLLHIGNLVKCEATLYAAETIAREDHPFMSLTQSSTTLSGRVRFNRILADACHVYSLLTLRTGHQKDAARYAKQSVALNRRIWAALESKIASKKGTQPVETDTIMTDSGQTAFDPLSSMRDDKGVPLVMSVTHASLNGPELWTLVPRLHRSLMQQSRVFAYQGLLHEAVFVAEQADKVASATTSRSLMMDNTSCCAEYWALSGRADKAQSAIGSICLSEPYTHVSVAAYHSSIARIYSLNKDHEQELKTYEKLEQILNELALPSFIRRMDRFTPDIDDLANQISSLTLDNPEPTKKVPTRGARSQKPDPKVAPRTTVKSAQKVVKPAAVSTTSISAECFTLQALQADMVLRRAMTALNREDHPGSLKLLQQVESFALAQDQHVQQLWVGFRSTLLQCFQAIANDFTFNTLPESTIAFPSINRGDHGTFEQPAIRSGAKTPARGGKRKKELKQDVIKMLCEGREKLKESYSLCLQSSSNHSFQQASLALGQATVLLSAIAGDDAHGSLHPLYAAHMSEIPKCNSLRLAQQSIEVEQESMSREDYLRWPELTARERHNLTPVSDFQKEYIDIIPKPWTVLSLSLNEDQDELYITRYESGLTPFVLRLPMARHTSRDMDEEEFSFADGKRDFDEIIELSDFSTRTAKDMTSREARLQWWTEREALDTRLHELLINIENIWLGGFKGIFSHHPRQTSLLARFRKSFDNILNRHLPSRQGRNQQKKPINLDARILELFVGLGDANNAELDLDEALTDLIYFVVDVLQFNGERNAYDEIDFDAVVIETLDALRSYHSTTIHDKPTEAPHTILVLDKHLHMFPWESLPCLQPLSISRLPSLASLRERVLAARSPTLAQDAQQGHYISTTAGGTSILNPSGDLTHTLKTLNPRLMELQGPWTHITDRAPSEVEFESALKSQDLVLYFGHGSGAQFVKSRAVGKLYQGAKKGEEEPGVATTLLFGCSSAHLTDNGIYEPSGMLASYLVAGAPAVVGMLWDVTDKDCDRFAVRTGELWGLWPEPKEEEVESAKSKKKGKGKVAQRIAEVESARGAGTAKGRLKNAGREAEDEKNRDANGEQRRMGLGLDEAVREARDACVLRYLNGAAAVVYGIPVFLE